MDLKVNYATLEHSERALSQIAGELEHAEARRDALADIWGSEAVAAAMVDFVNDWDAHRQTLIKDLHKVANMCSVSKRVFSATDQKMGSELNQAVQG